MKKLLLLAILTMGMANAQAYRQGFYIENIKHTKAIYSNTEKGETDDQIIKTAVAVFASKMFVPYIYDKQFTILFKREY